MNDDDPGLIAATFTPLAANGDLNLALVPALVDHLHGTGVDGLFVNGSTGEGESLTGDERCAVAEAYVEAARGRLPVFVQVGHNSAREAAALARHADRIGADAISATPPSYFRPRDVDALVDWLAEVAEGAPDRPLFYYHIPALTGVDLPMIELLARADRLPSLTGIKYSKVDPLDLPACVAAEDGRWTILFGCDEMLLTGLTTGCAGAVGTTYNYAAPCYRAIIDAYRRGDLATAEREQRWAAAMVALQVGHGGHPAFKATMALLGLDCGPHRRPFRSLDAAQREALRADLERFGFFERCGAATAGGR